MVTQSYVPKEIVALMGVVDTYKRWKNYEQSQDREYHYYHPSEWGKCLRAQQYKHYAQKGLISVPFKELDSRVLRLFDKGHNMHERWSHYFEDMGRILRGRWRCKNSCCYIFNDDGELISNLNKEKILKVLFKDKRRIYGDKSVNGVLKPEKCACGCKDFDYFETLVYDEELNIKGHADLILDFSNFDVDIFKNVRISFDKRFLPVNGKPIVGDMKTIGSSSWRFQLERFGAHKYYEIQLTIYAYILDCEYGVLMYENKDNSEMKWYKIERNDEWWDVIKWQSLTMQDMATSKKLPPPKPKDKSCYECKGCDFKNLCHSSKIWDDPKLDKKRKDFYKILL